MSPPDLREILKTKVDTVERPKLFPAGQYRGQIVKYEYGQSAQKKTDYIRYHVRLEHPVEGGGVDDEAMEGIDLSKRTLRSDFYLTPDALFRVKDFLVSLGVETTGRSFVETLPEAVNHDVLVSLSHRDIKRDDENETIAEINKMVGWKD